MCEEVKNPAVQVPKAMVATIFINTFAGLLFLIPLMFVLPDLEWLNSLPAFQPVPPILKSAMGSSAAAIGLLVPLMVLAIMCGIGCTTAASRCTWAFARDGAIPGSKLWMKINKTLDVPFNAMMLSMVVQILLGVIYFGSSSAFNAFSGVGVICLTAAYAAPIAISLFTGRKKVRTGRFYLGKLGTFCNVVALGKFTYDTYITFWTPLANRPPQPGLPSACRSSACPSSSPSPPPPSTTPPSSSSASPSSRASGTGPGATGTTPVPRLWTKRALSAREGGAVFFMQEAQPILFPRIERRGRLYM